MDWYHLADRTKPGSGASWVQGWSVGRGSSRIRKESAPSLSARL
jgi:alkaline phosphatase/alkaline phosphatase D